MQVTEFLDSLSDKGQNEMVFHFDDGERIPREYHVTEVKRVHIDSVDCGHKDDSWEEIIIQLWLNDKPAAADYKVDVRKFQGIWNAVASRFPFDTQATLRVEYMNHQTTGLYNVSHVQHQSGETLVGLEGINTSCKARDRVADACCGPVALNVVDTVNKAKACC